MGFEKNDLSETFPEVFEKMKNTIPDLTMIKWSWLGMSVLNCWFRFWIVEMEDRRLRL